MSNCQSKLNTLGDLWKMLRIINMTPYKIISKNSKVHPKSCVKYSKYSKVDYNYYSDKISSLLFKMKYSYKTTNILKLKLKLREKIAQMYKTKNEIKQKELFIYNNFMI